MKKFVIALCLIITGSLFAQNTAKDFFTKDDMVWYGLNFSKAKMIGQFDQAVGAGKASGFDLKNKWFVSWNNLIVMEPKNFELQEAFRKTSIFNDLTATDNQNRTVDPDKLLTYNSYSFSNPKETVQDIVNTLANGEKTEGIAVTFIVESFNKTSDEATVYVTIFDIKTKTIFITEKIIGKATGIGLRNFWAGAIKNIIKQIKSDYYKSWKSNFK